MFKSLGGLSIVIHLTMFKSLEKHYILARAHLSLNGIFKEILINYRAY